eukprot:ANDGO_02382.mRNA.1 hypothetical protein
MKQKWEEADKQVEDMKRALREKDDMLDDVLQKFAGLEKRVELVVKERDRLLLLQQASMSAVKPKGSLEQHVQHLQHVVGEKETEIQRLRFLNKKLQGAPKDAPSSPSASDKETASSDTKQCCKDDSVATQLIDSDARTSSVQDPVAKPSSSTPNDADTAGNQTSALASLATKHRLAVTKLREERDRADALSTTVDSLQAKLAATNAQLAESERNTHNFRQRYENAQSKARLETEKNEKFQGQLHQFLQQVEEKERATRRIVDQLVPLKAQAALATELQKQLGRREDDLVMAESRIAETDLQMGYLSETMERLVGIVDEVCEKEGIRKQDRKGSEDTAVDVFGKAFDTLGYVTQTMISIVTYIQAMKGELHVAEGICRELQATDSEKKRKKKRKQEDSSPKKEPEASDA